MIAAVQESPVNAGSRLAQLERENAALTAERDELSRRVAEFEYRLSQTAPPPAPSKEADGPAYQNLERRFAEQVQQNRQTRSLLQAIADNAPAVIYIKSLDGQFLLTNRLHAQLLGSTPEQVLGKRESDFFGEEIAREMDGVAQEVAKSKQPRSSEFELMLLGKQHTFLEIIFPIHDETGQLVAVGGISNDLTERKQAETDRATLHARIIEAQRTLISELSVPIIPLGERVLLMPLLGTLTRERAQGIAESLLGGIQAHRARLAIVDITGVRSADAEAWSAVSRIANAVRLLGAKVMLTGIRAELAKEIVQTNVALDGVMLVATLQAGVALAIGMR